MYPGSLAGCETKWRLNFSTWRSHALLNHQHRLPLQELPLPRPPPQRKPASNRANAAEEEARVAKLESPAGQRLSGPASRRRFRSASPASSGPVASAAERMAPETRPPIEPSGAVSLPAAPDPALPVPGRSSLLLAREWRECVDPAERRSSLGRGD